MADLTNPRSKRRVYQSEEAPLPIPIETITRKEATDGHWFFYTGHLSANCVLVKRQGDIIFLYRMGFFGKGILSKSKPQHQRFESSYQGVRRKKLPPKERKFQQQRFQQVRHHKFERHLSWQKLLAQQLKEKQRQENLPKDHSSSAELPPESPRETSSNSTSNDNPASNSSSEPNDGTEMQTLVSLHDIPSTSGLQTQHRVSKTESEDVKRERTGQIMEVHERQVTAYCVSKVEQGSPIKQREWMGESGEVCDLSVPSAALNQQDRGDVKTDEPTIDDVTSRTDDAIVTSDSEESVEELIIISDNEEGNSNDKEERTTKESKETKPDESKETEKDERTKKVVKKTDPFKIYEYLQLSFEEAFFLSFGLGCLSVLDEEENPMMLGRMWRTFCSRQANFLPKYVVYHYLRSKGWVPRGGTKYGADFVLYKKGPPFYHASYSVLVSMIDEHDSNKVSDKRFWNWAAVTGKNRITENVAKEVLVCYVLKPPGIQEKDLATPKCLHKFKVQEVVMKRWVSSREREVRDTVPLIS